MHPAMTKLPNRHQEPARAGQRPRPFARKGLAVLGLCCWLAAYVVLALALVPVILWTVLLSVIDPLHSWGRGRGKGGRGGMPHARFA
jgi:hypothetical protein